MDYHCAGGCGARVCHQGDWCPHCWPDDQDDSTETTEESKDECNTKNG